MTDVKRGVPSSREDSPEGSHVKVNFHHSSLMEKLGIEEKIIHTKKNRKNIIIVTIIV